MVARFGAYNAARRERRCKGCGRMRVFGFAGWSGSGKTTLIEALIPRLRAGGLTVSLIKHAHHAFDVDQPGKDSYRHRAAGALEVLVTSSQRYALMHELRGAPELTLEAALARLAPCDLVLVEGFKRSACPKLEVVGPEADRPPLFHADPDVIALAHDGAPLSGGRLPEYRRDAYGAIATLIVQSARSVQGAV
ncbi:MAG: molybdopterin-guanine dinucleotide biosynthesis protein B [Proteobacteria bacterium]|nr:molybdopterin-guanine dinucleotide biosynthesis protein B [Pseudomonadota bacterium]